MLNEWQEFLDYTGIVAYTAKSKNDISYGSLHLYHYFGIQGSGSGPDDYRSWVYVP